MRERLPRRAARRSRRRDRHDRPRDSGLRARRWRAAFGQMVRLGVETALERFVDEVERPGAHRGRHLRQPRPRRVPRRPLAGEPARRLPDRRPRHLAALRRGGTAGGLAPRSSSTSARTSSPTSTCSPSESAEGYALEQRAEAGERRQARARLVEALAVEPAEIRCRRGGGSRPGSSRRVRGRPWTTAAIDEAADRARARARARRGRPPRATESSARSSRDPAGAGPPPRDRGRGGRTAGVIGPVVHELAPGAACDGRSRRSRSPPPGLSDATPTSLALCSTPTLSSRPSSPRAASRRWTQRTGSCEATLRAWLDRPGQVQAVAARARRAPADRPLPRPPAARALRDRRSRIPTLASSCRLALRVRAAIAIERDADAPCSSPERRDAGPGRRAPPPRSAGHDVVALARRDLDITDADAVRRAVAGRPPAAVINCAAWTDVDGAEAHEDEATRSTATAAGNVAGAAANAGALARPRLHATTSSPATRPSPTSSPTRSRPHRRLRALEARRRGRRPRARAAPRDRPHRLALRAAAARTSSTPCAASPPSATRSPSSTTRSAARPTPATSPPRSSRSPSAGSPARCTSPAAGAAPGTTSPRRPSRPPAPRSPSTAARSADLDRPAPRPAFSVLVSERDDAPRLPDWHDGLPQSRPTSLHEAPRLRRRRLHRLALRAHPRDRARRRRRRPRQAHLRGPAREPRRLRAPVRARRDRGRRRGHRGVAGIDAVVNFAAETHVDRSIAEPDAFVRTHALGTHTLLEAARAAGVRYLQVSTDEVYGSIDEGTFTEDVAARTVVALLSDQGRRRPARPLLLPHLRDGDGDRPRLQQLRALPVPREADPADGAQRPARRLAAGLRRRPAGPQLDPRDRLRPRDRPRARARRPRRGLQRRRPGRVPEPRGRATASSPRRAPSTTSSSTSPTAPATTSATPSPRRRSARSAGSRACASTRASRRPSAWYRDNEAWWAPIRSGDYRAYYERQYGRALT